MRPHRAGYGGITPVSVENAAGRAIGCGAACAGLVSTSLVPVRLTGGKSARTEVWDTC